MKNYLKKSFSKKISRVYISFVLKRFCFNLERMYLRLAYYIMEK